MSKNKCPYCYPYKDDGYLYEDDISTITKNLYGKAQQVKWTGKNLNSYEADYDIMITHSVKWTVIRIVR